MITGQLDQRVTVERATTAQEDSDMGRAGHRMGCCGAAGMA